MAATATLPSIEADGGSPTPVPASPQREEAAGDGLMLPKLSEASPSAAASSATPDEDEAATADPERMPQLVEEDPAQPETTAEAPDTLLPILPDASEAEPAASATSSSAVATGAASVPAEDPAAQKAAVRVQAATRGRATRKDRAEQKKAASTLQASRRDQLDRREKAKAASKLQASRRGQLSRREGVARERSVVKVQAVQRGKRARKQAKQSSLSELLTGITAGRRQARKNVETLLHHQALEQDQHLLAQRRVIARNSPATFLQIVLNDFNTLGQWSTHTALRHTWMEAVLRLQYFVRARPFAALTPEAREELNAELKRKRRQTREWLADIQEMRDATREMATGFFNMLSPTLVKRIRDTKTRLKGFQPKAESAAANPAPNGDKGKVDEKREFEERINALRSHMHVVRSTQEELMRAEKKLKELEKLMLRFADKREAKLLKAAEDPYAPGGILKLIKKKQQARASSPKSPKSGKRLRNVWKAAERRELLKGAVAPKAAGNAHEELRMLRAETELVERLSQSVLNTKAALAAMREAGGAASLPSLPQPVAAMGLSAIVARAPPSRPRSRAVGLSPLPSPPRTAPSSHGTRRWTLPGNEDGTSVPHTPLWACSPSTGWHSHEQLVRHALPSSGAMPGRTSPQLAPIGCSHPEYEDDDEVLQTAMSTSMVPVQGPQIVDSYSKQLPWSPMRYEAKGSRWVTSVVPIEAAKARPPPLFERARRMRNAKSLPSLLAAAYVKNPSKFDPNAWGGYVR